MACKHDRRCNDTNSYAVGQVVGEHGGRNGEQHDDRLGTRARAKCLRHDAAPVEGSDRHHDHHGHECGEWDTGNEVAEHDDQDQQEDAGEQRGESASTAGAVVDDRLADHCASGHATEEAGSDVSNALALSFGVLVRVGVGQVVEQACGK